MLLINPATEQFGGFLSRYVPVGIPVAIGMLSAYLLKHGHPIQVHDDELKKLDETRLHELVAKMEKPLAFGITVLTSQAHRAYQIAKMIKKHYPDSMIVMGGIHVTALPEEGLRNGADVVVKGEGELTLLKIYEAYLEGREWRNEPGIAYLDHRGDFKANCDAPLIENLDEIPMFPYKLFENPKYDLGFIVSSRGCPYKCNYCSQRLMTGLTYRYRSPESIIAELDVLINTYGQKHIVFYDDNFSFKKKRVIDLCEALEASGLPKKSSFFLQTRADNFYPEILPYLKRASFNSVGFGMETAVQRLADEISKDETVQRHIEAINLGRENGMDVSVFMIFGLPTETHQDRMASYKFVNDMGMKFTKFNNLIPYPGTALYNRLKHTPYIQVEGLWENFNSTLTATRSIFNKIPLPYVPEGTTPWELKRDIMKCNLGFYFRPSTLWSVLTRRGGPGFVMLPKNWYFKGREMMEMIKLFLILLTNYLVALLPTSVGNAVYTLVTGINLNKEFERRVRSAKEGAAKPVKPSNRMLEHLPDAIDGTMRNLKIARAPKILTGAASPAASAQP